MQLNTEDRHLTVVSVALLKYPLSCIPALGKNFRKHICLIRPPHFVSVCEEFGFM